MWLVLAYNEITILKSSYGTLGRPCHPKKNTSHRPSFLVLKMVILLEILIIYFAKLILVYFRIITKVDL